MAPPANIRMIITVTWYATCGKMFLHITAFINFSVRLTLLSYSSLSLITYGSVQIAAAAKTSMTRFIQRSCTTLKGGLPIEQEAMKQVTNKLMFIVSWN